MRLVLAVILLGLLAPLALAQDNATTNSTGNASTNATSPTPATPAGPAEVALTATAHADGTDYYWTFDGQTGKNPTITLPPNAHVTVTVKNSGDQTHNFAVAPDTHGSDYVSSPADTATYTFTAPASGSVQYYCVPHKGSGMIGTFKIDAGAAGGETPAPVTETPAPTAITVTAHADGDSYYWTVDGLSGKNPTITVAPDTDIKVTVKNSGDQTHNFDVGIASSASEYVSSPADVVTYTFHSGAEGTSSDYFCVPHKSSGMKGTIKFAAKIVSGGASSGGAGGLTGKINGDAVDLGQFAPDCAGTQIPAPAAAHEIGGPTTADYVQQCRDAKAGISSDAETRAPSSADYVIPISLAVIALGVGVVVWVHKFYKP